MTSKFFRRLGNLRKRPRLRSWQPAFEGLERRLVLSGPGGGYTPAQIQGAYGFNQVPGLTGSHFNAAGAGQTIAIYEQDNDPNIRSDLQQFDEYYQLGGTAGNPADTSFLSVVNPYGGSTLPPAGDENADLAVEQALDVEWAHAIAPGARILVIDVDYALPPNTPATPALQDALAPAIQYATSQPDVSVVSISFGLQVAETGNPGEAPSESLLNGLFTTPAGHQGISFVAGSGDYGTTNYPAVSPNVLSVGGTDLPADAAGNPDRAEETAWSGSGGGISPYEAQPAYQQGIVTQSTTNRTSPDVAFNAAGPGFSIYDSFGSPSSPWTTGGGTSNATPCWAGLIAIADQLRVARGLGTLDGPTQLLPALYQISQTDPGAFQDITAGSNGNNSAGPGYDLVTGLGTPNAQDLIPDLAAAHFAASRPATVYWTGDAGDESWDDAGNWSDTDPLHGHGPDGVLPGPSDNVVIDTSGQTINFSSAGLQFYENDFFNAPVLSGSADPYVTIRSLNITGQDDTLDLADGVLDLSGGGPLGKFAARQTGDLVIMGGVVPGIDNAPFSDLPDPVGGVLRNAIVSAGTTIVIPGGSEGVVEGGVLDGTLQAESGSSLQMLGNWTNNGTITVATGALVNLGEAWSAALGDPGATAAAWVNRGVITTSDDEVFLGGWLTNTGTSFRSVAGLATDTVYLDGTLDNAGGTLVLAPGVSSTLGNWNLAEGRIDGGTVTESAGALLVPTAFVPAFPAGAAGNSAGYFADGYGLAILDGVTLNGDLDDSEFSGVLNIYDGITLNGNLNLDGLDSIAGFFGGRVVITGDASAGGSILTLEMTDVQATIVGAINFNTDSVGFDFSGGSLTVDGTAAFGGVFSEAQFSDSTRVTFNGGVVVDSIVLEFSDVGKVVINQELSVSGYDAAAFTDGSNLVLNGTLDVSAEGGVLYFDGTQPQSITGTGTIDLDGNPGDGVFPDDRDFFNDGGSQTLTIGRNITINSTGTRNEITGPIDNEGTIQTSASVLLINFGLVNPGSSSAPIAWVNRGTIAVTNAGSTLSLGGAWTNDGTITAAPAALLFLGDQWNALPLASYSDATQDAWVNHGKITAANADVGLGGWLSFAPKAANLATLNLGTDAIEVGGTLDNRGRTLTLAPGVTSTTGRWALDDGAILGGTVATTGGATLTATPAGGTLDGVTVAGTLDMSRYGDSTLTLLDGLTLPGTLQVGIGSTVNGAITNLGTIADETTGGSLTLSGPITNRGIVTVGAGSSFSTSASYTQFQGLTTVDGTLTATTVVIDGGTLDGSGTITANLTNSATVAPGDPGTTGTLTVQGNYTQTGSGVIVIALSSASSSQLAVSGHATLAGTFTVSALPGFVPNSGSSFTPLTFTTRSGQFAAMTGLQLGGGAILVASYGADDLVLVVQVATRPTPVGH